MPTLPRPPTSFVGRERELARSRDPLSRTPLLTLTGPGGSGKTRLAIKLAGDIRAVHLHQLAGVVDLEVKRDMEGALLTSGQPLLKTEG
jgi:hypothetical protein